MTTTEELSMMSNEHCIRPVTSTFSENNWNILANCWHPVALSSEVSDKPFAATLLDVPLIIYRTSGGITVAKRNCPHRGADLSQGWLKDDQLVCAYHGLHYDSSGQCTLVPAEGHDAKVSLKLRLSTFQAAERYGLIWACLGSEPRFSLPDWNPLESSEYQVIELSTEWQTSAARHTENFLDIAHAAWIHADTFAPRDYPEIGKFDVERTAEGLYYEIKTMFLAANTFEYKGAVEECLSEYTLTMPYSICLKVTSSLGVEYIFDVATPVSADRIRIFMLKARDFDKDKPVSDWLHFQEVVNEEDRKIVENQYPAYLPLDLSQEFHIRADIISIAYRRKLSELGIQQEGGY